MPDREKVISALRCRAYDDDFSCWECAYYKQDEKPVARCDYRGLMDDVIALLKEQETVEWINVKERLPEKDGQYLVVYTFFDYKGMGVVRFSHNLHEIDEYIFDTESRPGWYEPDDEVGYFERTTVTHWAKLPEFPQEGR